MRILLAIAALACIPAAAALANPAADVSKMSSDDCARARKLNKTCVLTIESESVDGKTPTAGGEQIVTAPHPTMNSLIRIRRDFIVEILKTAEDL
jgi:hypothetical protein